jgi:hypothetical protein
MTRRGHGQRPYSLAMAARLASSMSTMTVSGSGFGTSRRLRIIVSNATCRMLAVRLKAAASTTTNSENATAR